MKILLTLLLLIPSLALASQRYVATFDDPAGDDNGAGILSYPARADFQPGNLDLRQVRISRSDDGFWFEATFRNAIRDPANVPDTNGGESLANFARKGFYQFNIDFYLDTDRLPGSGNIHTLPGRKVQISPDFAWERAVILTPRPELMHEQLLQAMTEQQPAQSRATIESDLDKSVIFPTQIRVRGRTISCFVPNEFFSGSDGSSWGVTALVTGAQTSVGMSLTLFGAEKPSIDKLDLGVMQPAIGHPTETFGYTTGVQPAPIVDMLAPTVALQAQQLTAMHDIGGIAFNVQDQSTPSAATAPASPESRALEHTTIDSLLGPEEPSESSADTPAATIKSPQDYPSIAERLRTLKQLYDQELIDENEYKQQKLRFLNQL